MEFYTFSFIQGVLAFLAPCAVALLPGYIVAFISRSGNSHPGIAGRLNRGFKLALLSIAGIFTIYAIATVIILSAAQLLKDYMIWITIGMGVFLIIIGILMAAGKSFSFTINVSHATPKSEVAEAFLFGIAYAIGALGCLFPLFLIVATQAIAAPSAWIGAGYFGAYFSGMSLMMIGVITLSVLARDVMMKYLRKIMPHMEVITGWLLIVAGGYIIYYQSFLMY